MHKIIYTYYFILIAPLLSGTLWAQSDLSLELPANDTELYSKSISRDIANSSYFELLAWSQRLNIDNGGSSVELRNRLYDYYNVTVESTNISQAPSANILTIKSASNVRVFDIEKKKGENSENYIEISGGVEIILDDKSNGLVHTIQTDSLYLNRDSNMMTAVGNIVYEKLTDGKTERFFGDSLTFNIKSWKGVIFEGIYSRTQDISVQNSKDLVPLKDKPGYEKSTDTNIVKDSILGSENVYRKTNFFFKGDSLANGEGDLVIIDKGRISTENVDNPYFQIKATKLWVLGPGEWSMLMGTLYVGHIPVLFIPFYYTSDSDVFFHPAFGILEENGNFIQTTTYLIGSRKSVNEDSLSFLPISSELDHFRMVWDGFYRRAEKIAASEAKTSNRDFLKLMLDYYNKKGLYTGFELGLASNNIWDSFALKFGLAFSHSVDSNGSIAFLSESRGVYDIYTHDSYVFGIDVPFRFGTDFTFKTSFLSLDFKYYSDQDFNKNFGTRMETFDWVTYGLSRIQDTDNTSTTSSASSSITTDKTQISNFTWLLSFNPKLEFDFLQPVINSISLNTYLRSKWSRRIDSAIPTHDPGRSFFYMENIYLPEIDLSIRGNIWPLNTNKKGYDEVEELRSSWNAENGLEEPVEAGVEEESPILSELDLYKKDIELPEIYQNITVVEDKFFSFKTSYTINSKLNFKSDTVNSNWRTAQSIDNKFYWTLFDTNNSLLLDSSLGFFNNFVSLSHTTGLSSIHKEYFPLFLDSVEPSSATLETALKAEKQLWTETFSLAVKPLFFIDSFADTSIKYDISFYLYNRYYDTNLKANTEKWVSLEKDRFNKHQVNFNLDFHPIKDGSVLLEDLQIKNSLVTIFEPLYKKNTWDILFNIKTFYWTNNVKWQFIENSNDNPAVKSDEIGWKAQPISYTSTFKPLDRVSVSNRLIYNFTKDYIDSNKSSFELWWFYGSLEFGYTTDYKWNSTNFRWDSQVEKKFLPKEAILGFKLQTDVASIWKNRIKTAFFIQLEWKQDLIRYNKTSDLNLTLKWAFYIYKFLDIQITFVTGNSYLYLYYPFSRQEMGINTNDNFFEDLFKSFNIFNVQDLYDTHFNMKSIEILAIHNLNDWDVMFEYKGEPKVVGGNQVWKSSFGFYLRWIPVPILKRSLSYNDVDRVLETVAN